MNHTHRRRPEQPARRPHRRPYLQPLGTLTTLTTLPALATLTTLAAALLLLPALVVLGSASPARAGDDRRLGNTGFEPHNATANPRRPGQVAVMQGCTIRIDNNYGKDGFPVTRTSTLPCSGDPVLAFDSQGRLFVTHLSTNFNSTTGRFGVGAAQINDTTTANTQTYTATQVSGNSPSNHDKPWLVADANPASPYRDSLYLVWTHLTGPQWQIQFSRLTPGATAWSPPSVLSAAGEGNVWPSHAAVAANGDLYVAYHANLCNEGFDGAANQGTTQLLRDGSGGADFAAGTVQQRESAFTAGQSTVTCNVQSDPGNDVPGTDFWLQGSMQPWILPDPARPGNVYVIANDDPDNTFAGGDDADVVIARSTDHGRTFTRGRVDHGPGQTFAVMPTAHIDQDGNAAVTWYDNRSGRRNNGTGPNGGSNFLLELYGTTSRDGGLTWSPDFRVGDAPFDPDLNAPCRFSCTAGSTQQTLRIGEYNGLWTVDGIGYATWTGNTTPPTATAQAQGAQTTYFDVFSTLAAFPDPAEPNESADAAVAAALGSDDRFNRARLTLHTATDVDFFRIEPRHTGHVTAEVTFNEVVSPLLVRAYDKYGRLLAAGTAATARPGTSTSRLAVPVVQDEPYFLAISDRDVADPSRPGDASPTDPPQAVYDLAVANRAAPEPFGLDLKRESDSGRFDNDDVTRIAGPDLLLRVNDAELRAAGIALSPQNATPELDDDAPGFKVAVERDGQRVGFAQPVDPVAKPGLYRIRLDPVLTEGENLITAEVIVLDPSDDPRTAGTSHVTGSGAESAHRLLVTLDTTPPALPAAAPDLLPSSDTGGNDADNITTLVKPAFQGASVEPNALVRLLATPATGGAGPAVVGKDTVTSGGEYQVVSSALRDGTYGIGVQLEDLAGNVSQTSPVLGVTVAKYALRLTGATSGLVVDIADGRVTGYPGVPGGFVGILGIPLVHLDASGRGAAVLGGARDDRLTFTPTGTDSGRLTRAASAQTLNFLHVAGDVTVSPEGGDDEVTIVGTTRGDRIRSVVDAFTTLRVEALPLDLRAPQKLRALLGLRITTGQTERIGVLAGGGQDTVDITVDDTVGAQLSVDGGAPTGVEPQKGDELVVRAGSPNAVMQEDRAEKSGAGSVFVGYPETTRAKTRVDFSDIESVTPNNDRPEGKEDKRAGGTH
ncbi:Ig-like domain-containing protein [Streptomyces sp. NPDC007369]|uniref:Ig-like domain-containing protein n=1 Tax=Streptomyces sp. NPDC007369 TaxID=3154589 RepID=UPI0033D326F7